MLNFNLYAIRTDYIREYFLSFEDAVKGRFKYANFYRPNGCVDIIKYAKDKPRHISEEWHIDMNYNDTKQVVTEYKNWDKKIFKENYKEGLDEWPIE